MVLGTSLTLKWGKRPIVEMDGVEVPMTVFSSVRTQSLFTEKKLCCYRYHSDSCKEYDQGIRGQRCPTLGTCVSPNVKSSF